MFWDTVSFWDHICYSHMDVNKRGYVKVLCSIHLYTLLNMRVLASLVREQTVREQTACIYSGNAAALIVRIDKDVTTAIANRLDIYGHRIPYVVQHQF
jgi:hypothetical protein